MWRSHHNSTNRSCLRPTSAAGSGTNATWQSTVTGRVPPVLRMCLRWTGSPVTEAKVTATTACVPRGQTSASSSMEHVCALLWVTNMRMFYSLEMYVSVICLIAPSCHCGPRWLLQLQQERTLLWFLQTSLQQPVHPLPSSVSFHLLCDACFSWELQRKSKHTLPLFLRDVLCGKLFCQGGDANPSYGQMVSISSCKAAFFTDYTKDYGQVDEGTTCGNGKVLLLLLELLFLYQNLKIPLVAILKHSVWVFFEGVQPESVHGPRGSVQKHKLLW